MRTPLAFALGAVLVVVPALILALWRSGAELAASREVNRDLVETALRTAFADWCAHRGRELERQLDATHAALRAVGSFDGSVGAVKAPSVELVRLAWRHHQLYQEDRIPAPSQRLTARFGDQGEIERELVVAQPRARELVPELSATDALIAHERAIADLANRDARAAVQRVEEVVRTMRQAGYRSAAFTDFRHRWEEAGSEFRFAILAEADDTGGGTPLVELAREDGLVEGGSLSEVVRAGHWRRALLMAQSTSSSEERHAVLAELRRALARGHAHLAPAQWQHLIATVEELGADGDAWRALANRWRENDALLEHFTAGPASDPRWRAWAWEGDRAWFDRLLEDRRWWQDHIAKHAFVWQYQGREFALAEHVELLRRELESADEDRFLRVHQLPRHDQLPMTYALALHPAALEQVLGDLAADRGAGRWSIVALLAAVLLGIGLLVATLHRERRLVRTRERFLAEAAHELKTPAALIRLHAETLALDRIHDPEQRRRYLETVAAESQHLGDLVEKTLAGARAQAGTLRYRFEDDDLAALVRATVDGFAHRYGEDGPRFVCADCPDSLLARFDPTALRQVLVNLLDNAVKYAGSGEVAVSLRRGEAIELTVADHGPGIPVAERARALEPFVRLERERQRGGTGLGLALAERAVRAHGGRLELADTPGGGLTVRIHLPRSGCRED